MTNSSINRDKIREEVFKRDNYLCVICKVNKAQDCHHILERKLFKDENFGYLLDNLSSLCASCHLKAEMTLISVEEIREACGIKKKILPEHLYGDEIMDKWGNIILPNGQRLRGELFYDQNTQRILREGGVLDLYTKYVKYPRTFHVPFSEGITDDDRVIDSLDIFDDVVVSIKSDGENSSIYSDFFHARSLNEKNHSSRTWLKNFISKFQYDIPENFRICGENLYAQHTIKYDDLESYFYGFSVWEDLKCLSWKETLEWFDLLGIVPVPVIFQGKFNQKAIHDIYEKDFSNHEGYVIRNSCSFNYSDFRNNVAKFVSKKFRKNLEENPANFKHWSQRIVIPNQLKKNEKD